MRTEDKDTPNDLPDTLDIVTNSELMRQVFSRMNCGVAYHKILLDGEGRPVDYEFLDINPAFERLTGLKRQEVIGRRVTEVIPGIKEADFDWIVRYGKVALTGEEIQFEQYFEPLGNRYPG